MDKKSLHQVYDEAYAASYNETFLLNPFSKGGADFELNVLKQLVRPETKWLDLGCGTGYFLSQFPGIQRAGLDITPAMLAEARKVNPDVMFLEEGDFRDPHPQWNEQWTLVTTMWNPYSYVESIWEVEKMVRNMISWTATGGTIFIPAMDLEDLRPNTFVDYDEKVDMYGGSIAITSYTWSWLEHSGRYHENLVAPHTGHFVRLLSESFETVEVLRYPTYQPGWVSRKGIVAKGKLAAAPVAGYQAKIIWHPVPDPYHPSNRTASAVKPNISVFSLKQLVGELAKRIGNGSAFRAIIRNLFNR